jgi:hypothetical protein
VKHCAACEASREFCRLCQEPICGSHRWGTGDLSDGYYCLGEHRRVVPAQATAPVGRRLARAWDNPANRRVARSVAETALLLFIGIVIGLVLAIGAVIATRGLR